MPTEQQGQILMARQPIFDRGLKVAAYELLYRADTGQEADFLDGDQASSDVLLSNYTSISDEGTVKKVPAFINLTRELLVKQRLPTVLHKNIVIEILEDIPVDDEVLDAVRQLKADGFRIALDDFIWDESYIPLLELVDIVKVDLLAITRQELQTYARLLSPFDVILLAEKIETHEQFNVCVKLGFELFQGYFLSRPRLVKGKKISAKSVALIQLIQALQNPEMTATEVEELIIKDPVLTYKLLRIVNSAAYSFVRNVESLNQAIVLLGIEQVRKWATLIALCANKDKPEELSRVLLARGRMCEQLAEAMRFANTSSFFMVGMMSDINALLDMEMDRLLEQIPLNDEIKAALADHAGPMGRVLKTTLAYERGEWDSLDEVEIDSALYERAYRHSLSWAQQTLQAIH